jgi:hypothetical protein
VLFRLGRIQAALYDEIMLRWKSWLWLVLFMLGPILLGAGWVHRRQRMFRGRRRAETPLLRRPAAAFVEYDSTVPVGGGEPGPLVFRGRAVLHDEDRVAFL